MKKYLLLFLVVLLASVDVCAQRYNVYIKQADGSPAMQVDVYSFARESLAKASYAKYKELHYVDDSKAMETTRTNNEGYCVITCDREGYIVVDDAMLKNPQLYSVAKLAGNGIDIHIVLPARKDAGKTRKNEAGEMETDLDQVEKRQALPPPPPAPPIPYSYGRKKTIGGHFTIDADLARNDARFVVFPRVFFPAQDSVLYLKPTVVDGASYRESMERRMGFDFTNDKLDSYHFDKSFEMQAHGEDMFLYTQNIEVDKGVAYHADAQIWYEDYNGVYHRYNQKLQDGKEAEPMRFLDWEAAKRSVVIDTVQYKKVGKMETSKVPANFKLDFEVAKESLNMNDSLTMLECNKMLDMFRQSRGSDNNVTVLGITVRGYSSPEGQFARNRMLSRGRANTVVNLIKREFPNLSREIKAELDENDNVVPWQAVADVMKKSTDPVVLNYASIIDNVLERKSGYDAPQSELRTHKELWAYVKDSVLPSVRRTEIVTELQLTRILPLEEIIQRYNTDADFRAGRGITQAQDYMYYELMCWLAKNEDWDGLYTISKAVYESPAMVEMGKQKHVRRGRMNRNQDAVGGDTVETYVKSRPGYVYLGIKSDLKDASDKVVYKLNDRVIENESAQKPGKYNFSICMGDVVLYSQQIELVSSKPHVLTVGLESETSSYPYPLAAYYYASSLLHKGEVDTKIIRQYLDDGAVNRKNWGQIQFNDIAMITTQILMHCQDGDFNSANRLIVKYNLSADDPKLKPLIMFVRCLAGEFLTNTEIQDYVKSTSLMNRAVVLAALENWDDALEILNDSMPQEDVRVQYLKAICKFKDLGSTMIQPDHDPYNSSAVFIDEESGAIGDPFAAPMLKAFELDESNVEYIKTDGYFNDAYRLLVLYFWKRLSEGMKITDVAKEYDALVNERAKSAN